MEKKTKYLEAKIEIVCFDTSDVIATSGYLGDSGIDYGGWSKSGVDWS